MLRERISAFFPNKSGNGLRGGKKPNHSYYCVVYLAINLGQVVLLYEKKEKETILIGENDRKRWKPHVNQQGPDGPPEGKRGLQPVLCMDDI